MNEMTMNIIRTRLQIRDRSGARLVTPCAAALLVVVSVGMFLMQGASAWGLEVQTIARVKGLEENELVGMGLVTGLNGTGDSSKKSKTAVRALAEVYKRNGFLVDRLEDLSSVDSIAVVMISCTVPATGIREGDRLDVRVSIVGDATSLKGGALMWTILRLGPLPELYAKASGSIRVNDVDPRNGVIHGGAQMLRDIRMSALAPGSRTASLVLRDAYAGFPVATALANRITQEFAFDLNTPGEVWATADGPKTVTVQFSPKSNPTELLAQIMTINMDTNLLQTPARVLINQDAGIFTVTGNVEISPFLLTARGMTISRIVPEPAATVQNPIQKTDRQVLVGAAKSGSVAAKARLQDLLDAFAAMDVPFDDRVEILYEMKKIGVLHAQLITD